MSPKPFTLRIPDAQIAELRERLARTRLPDEPPLAPWSTGTSLAYLKSLTRLLAERLRLARLGRQAQRLPPVHAADRRHRPAFHPCAVAQAERDAAADFARLARLGVRVPQDHSAADRALPRRGAVAARLHALVQAGPAALRRDRDRGHVRRADERARLPTLRRAGRRLGQLHHLGARPSLPAAHHRHPPQSAAGAARSRDAAEPERRGEGLSRAAQQFHQGGDRLSVDPGHAAADACVRR